MPLPCCSAAAALAGFTEELFEHRLLTFAFSRQRVHLPVPEAGVEEGHDLGQTVARTDVAEFAAGVDLQPQHLIGPGAAVPAVTGPIAERPAQRGEYRVVFSLLDAESPLFVILKTRSGQGHTGRFDCSVNSQTRHARARLSSVWSGPR